MKFPTKDFVEQLLNSEKETLKVSIFIPTHPVSNSENLNKDRIRFKNAVAEAKKEIQKSTSKNEFDNIFKHLNRIYDDLDFWKHLSRTLAVFVNEDNLSYRHLDIEVDENVHVGKSYFTLPLLAVLERKTDYYLLDVNFENPRLFKGNRYNFEQIHNDIIPNELEKALNIDEHQKQLQHYAIDSSNASYHGHGGYKDKTDIDLNNYLKRLDKIIHDAELDGTNDTLILSGAKNTTSRFRHISGYKSIHSESIDGNKSNTPIRSLHEQSWSLILKKLGQEQRNKTRRIKQLIGQDKSKVLTDISHIEKALDEGRVQTLVIEMFDESKDSMLDRMVQAIKLKPFSKMTGEKISQLAEKNFKQSGEIMPLNYKQLPLKTTRLAAILRY